MPLTIHTYTAAPGNFFVNSFILEGPRSLVLVDTQFVLSEARGLLERMAGLEKKLAGIVITHPHPDHYNGLATVLAAHPATPVFATAATSAGIRDTAEPKRAYWTPIIGADYPQTFAFPDQPLASGDTLGIDGIELTVTDFGAAECADNTAVALPQADAVIISDLVYNRVHPWLAEGRVQPWLDALRRAQSLFAGAATLYAGHGPSGPHAILADQITYIEAMREAAATAPSKTVVRDRMLALFPNFELANLVDLNADALRQ